MSNPNPKDPQLPVLDLEQYRVEKPALAEVKRTSGRDHDPDYETELAAYRIYMKNMRRFKTSEEFVEFSRHNFVFYKDDLGMRLQQVIETEEQFISFLQRCCMHYYEADDTPWIMWLVNSDEAMRKYVRPTQQLVDRVNRRIEEEGEAEAWLLDDEEVYYSPDHKIEAWQADYNQFYDEPFEVHKTEVKVFLPGDLEVTEEYKAKMPFLARFLSLNTFDRMGSIEGQDLEIIPLSTLTNDVISIR